MIYMNTNYIKSISKINKTIDYNKQKFSDNKKNSNSNLSEDFKHILNIEKEKYQVSNEKVLKKSRFF